MNNDKGVRHIFQGVCKPCNWEGTQWSGVKAYQKAEQEYQSHKHGAYHKMVIKNGQCGNQPRVYFSDVPRTIQSGTVICTSPKAHIGDHKCIIRGEQIAHWPNANV